MPDCRLVRLQSPFLGRREKLESATQLLYPRYRSLSDALLVRQPYNQQQHFQHLVNNGFKQQTFSLQYAEGAPVPAPSPAKIVPAQQIVTPIGAQLYHRGQPCTFVQLQAWFKVTYAPCVFCSCKWQSSSCSDTSDSHSSGSCSSCPYKVRIVSLLVFSFWRVFLLFCCDSHVICTGCCSLYACSVDVQAICC